MPARALLIAVPVALGVALAGCGGAGEDRPATGAAGGPATTSPAPEGPGGGAPSSAGGTTGATPPAAAGPPGTAAAPSTTAGPTTTAPTTTAPPPRDWTATCPTATTSPLGCRGVRGRVLSIQSHDPDGDGDLHVIAVGGDVTLPGITVFDVRASLRPRRDPVEGEYVTGAGPVFRGSLGQKQIQVDVFRVWRPRG